jgi:2-hydroxychromene-2-carboxylate isomerase
MRACVWAERYDRQDALVRALFRRAFTEGADLHDLAVVGETVAALGLDPAEMRAAVAEPEVKQVLKDRTNAAVEAGVPGVPTVEVGGELLWGDDRLEDAAALRQ